jgi:2-oxoglutarate ferredoxin oxidoreductase subunit delta
VAEQTGTEPAHRHAVARPRSSRQAPRVVIDLDLCKSCGICQRLCPSNVLDKDRKGRPAVARAEDCTACRFCEQHCPDFAIEVFQAGGAADRRAADRAAGENAAADEESAVTTSSKGGD